MHIYIHIYIYGTKKVGVNQIWMVWKVLHNLYKKENKYVDKRPFQVEDFFFFWLGNISKNTNELVGLMRIDILNVTILFKRKYPLSSFSRHEGGNGGKNKYFQSQK